MNVFVIARPGEIFWEGTTNKTKHRKQEFMQHKWEIHMKRQKLVWSHPKFKIWPTVDSRNLFESYWIREFHLWILNLLPKSLQNAMNVGILIQDNWSPIASNGFQERSRNSSAPSMVPVSWMEHRKINGKSMVNQWQINGDWFIMVNIYGISMEYLWKIYGISMIHLWYIYWIWFSCGKHHESIASKGLFSIHRMMIPQKDPAMTKHIWVRWHPSCSPGRLLGSLPIWMARWYRLCLVFYIGFYIGLFPFMAIFHIHHLRYFPARHLHLVWGCLGRLSMVPTPTPVSWLCPATHLRLGSIHFRSQMGL